MATKKGSKKVMTIAIAAGVLLLIIGGFIFIPKVIGFVQDNLMRKPAGGKNQTGGDDRPNQPPVADLTSNRSILKVGEYVTLDGNGSYDPDAEAGLANRGIYSYLWDVGDGSTPQSTVNGTIFHSYSAPGTYSVTMTVFDDEGASDSDNVTIKVVPQDEVIATSSAILLADPIIGIMPNSTSVNWTIKEGAKVMKLSITLTGANIRETQSSRIEVIIFDPYERTVKNETVNVILAQQLSWEFFEDEISLPGEYRLVVRCIGGMALITVQGSVSYL